MQLTLKDIARESGYSLATVSRVLGGSDRPVSQKARDAILKKAEELNYVPNLMARGLKSNASSEIAVVIPSVMNLHFSAMVMGVEEALADSGYSLTVYLVDHGHNWEKTFRNILSRRVYGVVIAADSLSPETAHQLSQLKEAGIPVVIADNEPDFVDRFPGVYFDYRRGSRLGTDYLLRNGHRHIAYLSREIDRISRLRRLEGYRDALKSHDITPREEDIFISRMRGSFESGIELADMLLDSTREYTAIMANNDAVAVGILAQLTARGVRVPRDLSVMGFDDSVFAKMSLPLLTTVRVDAEQIGRRACQFIFSIRDGQAIDYSIYQEPVVIERDSVIRL